MNIQASLGEQNVAVRQENKDDVRQTKQKGMDNESTHYSQNCLRAVVILV